jgi:hypothetical protein
MRSDEESEREARGERGGGISSGVHSSFEAAASPCHVNSLFNPVQALQILLH